jgi:hypothetical protein
MNCFQGTRLRLLASRTLIRTFEGAATKAAYDVVRRYAGRWSKETGHSTAAAFLPLTFAPGEAYRFDGSHEVMLLSGVTVIVKAAGLLAGWGEIEPTASA